MRRDQLIEVHPTLYHMAEADAWESVVQHGLLSTSHLLDLYEVDGAERGAIESARRRDSVVITSRKHGTAVIRDNKPLAERRLAACLSGMSPADYYRLLNERVFFWPTSRRLEGLLRARAYRARPHLVITVDTQRLLDGHGSRVSLSTINSGAALFSAPARGPETFRSIADFDFDLARQRRSRSTAIAEVAVTGGVKPILEVADQAAIIAPDGAERTIWRRR